MSDPALDDLKRRAFSSDSEDALAARGQLAELDATEESAPAPLNTAPLELPHPERSRQLLGWIAVVGSVALIAATVIATTPQSSLAVFDRTATAKDAEMEQRVPQWALRAFPRPAGLEGIDPYWDVVAIEGTARWLGESQGYDVFGFLGEGLEPVDGAVVCLSISRAPALMAIRCVPTDDFLASGIQEYRQSRPVDEQVHLSVLWGPTGEARIFDRPLDEVGPR